MNRERKFDLIRRRSEPWDVVVVGGGATGAGCALDAASRGLSVLLLEQSDFGKGTSSRSTKLIHGGVRYLEQGNISLVREALAERKLLLDLASEFVKPQPFIVPCYGWNEKLYYGAGLKVYDTLAGRNSIGRTELLSLRETKEALPGLAEGNLTGGVLYLDAQFDDARFLMAVIETAQDQGCVALNYARVEGFEKDGSARIDRVRVRDIETGEVFLVGTRSVINAGGIFADAIEGLVDDKGVDRTSFSQGIHLVFDQGFLAGENALMIPKTSDGRVLFAIPWHGRLLVGTTDTPLDKPELEPVAFEREVDFVLETCVGYFSNPPGRSDVLSVFAGIRPLIGAQQQGNTSKISREHLVEIAKPGLISVRGGKWTTYRRMAEDAVDIAVAEADLGGGMSRSSEIHIRDLAARRVAKIAKSEPTLADQVTKGFLLSKAEVLDAVRSGMARKIEDVLSRRTRHLLLDAKAASEAAQDVGELIAQELGWSDQRLKEEVEEFRKLAGKYHLSGDRSFTNSSM